MGNSIIDMYIPMSMIEFANSCMVSCEFVFFSGFVFNFQRKLPNKVQTIKKTLFFPYALYGSTTTEKNLTLLIFQPHFTASTYAAIAHSSTCGLQGHS